MNYIAIRNEVRRRMIFATGINPTTCLKVAGETFNPENLPCWVEEFMIGGTPKNFTNKRSKISSFMIQYDFNVPAGKNMDEVDVMASRVESEFDIDDSSKQTIELDGYDCRVKEIRQSRSQGTQWNTIKILLILEVIKNAS